MHGVPMQGMIGTLTQPVRRNEFTRRFQTSRERHRDLPQALDAEVISDLAEYHEVEGAGRDTVCQMRVMYLYIGKPGTPLTCQPYGGRR